MPYRGNGPALQDLVAGQIDLQIEPASNFFAQAKAGAIKPYAITSRQSQHGGRRHPDHRRGRDAGLPGVALVRALGAEGHAEGHRRADSMPRCSRRWRTTETRKRFADLGIAAPPREQQTPEALRAFQKAEADKWWPIIKAANIKGQ